MAQLFPSLAILIAFSLCGGTLHGEELPDGILERLASDEFRAREEASAKLVDWARLKPEAAMDRLFELSRTATEPEVRDRCLSALKVLVGDLYLKEGEGYIGIRMQDEFANVPGDPKPRGVIRVIQVVEDSAADLAGLRLNDLIAGLNGTIWHEGPVSIPFGDKVRQFKPGDEVLLKVLREGNLIDVTVKLGRRPAFADRMFLSDSEEDIQAAEQAAKDGYFKRWLDRKKAAK
jgi:predicted metalloprotease with PDZ domain